MAQAPAAKTPVVALSHVSLTFDDGTQALDDVTLQVARGERLCVLGANGSGKSTLASVVCGLLAPDAGTVELAGEHVFADGTPDLDAYRRARRNLGLVFQNPDDQIVTSVVADDVAFGPENLGLPRDQIALRVERELKRVAMTAYAQADPTRLSGGQRQRVCIAGALALEPQVLVLDEPSSLLDVRGREAILRVMGRLASAGTTLVHVTHFMDEALQADRVLVLDHGRVALLGTPDEVFGSGAAVIDRLGLEEPFAARLSKRLPVAWTVDENLLVKELGDKRRGAAVRNGAAAAAAAPASEATSATAVASAPASAAEKPLPSRTARSPRTFSPQGAAADAIVRVDHVSFAYGPRVRALQDVSLAVEPGTATAIVGQTGSGKSTLLRLLCGLETPDAGTIEIAGATTKTKRGRKLVRSAVGYVMQHPERQLFAETVYKDVAFGPRNLRLPADEVERRVQAALELTGLADRREASPFSLSGGQRRLCALAGILAMEPRVLILDEPTAGLDPRSRAMLRQVLRRLLNAGTTLIQVTHSMEDAARCDHVVVLDESRILMDGTPREVFCPEHAAVLTAVGLGIPRAQRVAAELEAQGFAPLGTPITTDELVAAIMAQLPDEAFRAPGAPAPEPASEPTQPAPQPAEPAAKPSQAATPQQRTPEVVHHGL